MDFIYDEECYPNVWTLGILNAETGDRFNFEISDRRNDAAALHEFIMQLNGGVQRSRWNYAPTPHRMVGFNNVGYDYVLLHEVMKRHKEITHHELYNKSQQIFSSEDRYTCMVWDSEHWVTQIDLYLIHHFDNKSKRCGLKDLEFAMRMKSIRDLPFKPGTILDNEQIDTLISYQWHDIEATYQFYLASKPMIDARDVLSAKYNKNMLNFNDTKIGKNRFIDMLEEKQKGICYDYSSGRKEPMQTFRPSIKVSDVIFNYVKFDRPEFQALHARLLEEVITDTRAGFSEASVTIDGFTFEFGMGGLHGSISSEIVKPREGEKLIDVDVTSYYPSIAIQNRLYPEHLGELFVEIYGGLKVERAAYDKSQPENAMYKLALNGSFGDTNNIFSPLYDPLFTMRTTINGQLMLAMLAERLMAIKTLRLIQANTDGLTFTVSERFESLAMGICKQWERLTALDLERADYDLMAIRDVNNYIARYTNGKIKNKGCYVYDCEWHKDHSHKIVAKAAEQALIYGTDIEEYIKSPDRDIYDFMGRAKVPRNSRLVAVTSDNETELQRISRYYVSQTGVSLVKIMPPLPKKLALYPDSPERHIGLAPTTGWKCTVVNDEPCANDVRNNLDFMFYIERTRKIVDILKKND